MKNIILFISVVCTITLSSCSKSEEETNQNNVQNFLRFKQDGVQQEMTILLSVYEKTKKNLAIQAAAKGSGNVLEFVIENIDIQAGKTYDLKKFSGGADYFAPPANGVQIEFNHSESSGSLTITSLGQNVANAQFMSGTFSFKGKDKNSNKVLSFTEGEFKFLK